MLASDASLTTPIWMEFRDCSLAGKRQFGATEGHRGTRQPASCRARVLSDTCDGSFSGRLSVTEIDWIMPYVFGTTASSTLIPGETLSPFWALVDKVAAMYRYNSLYINTFTLSGSETQYLDWSFGCLGFTETSWLSSWPASPIAPECGTAFAFQDVTFTFAGTVYKPSSFTFQINNNLAPLIETSVSPTGFETQNMQVTLDMTFDFRTANLGLYRYALAGGAATLAFSDGSTTYTLNFGNLKIPDGAPTIPQTGRVNMPLKMEAFRATNATVNAADNVVRFIKT